MKHILIYILSFLCLTTLSCSHDMEGFTPGSQSSDSINVTLNVQVPGQNTPTTYSIDDVAENYIESIDVLAFIIDPDDNTEKFSYHSTGDLTIDQGAEKTFKVTLLRSKEQYRFVVITNARQEIKELGKLEKETLKEDILNKLIFRNSAKWDATSPSQFTPFPMWGESEPTVIDSEIQVISDMRLTRMVARIDVALTTDEAKSVFQLESIHVFNRKTRGHIVPNTTAEYWGTESNSAYEKALKATMPEDNIEGDPLTIVEAISYTKEASPDVSFYQDIYVFEADAPKSGEAHEATCLVIGGIFEDDEKPTYYRIDFLEKDKKTYKDILRNHWYKVNIVKVEESGYDTPEEAFDARTLNMEVEIVMWDQEEMKDIVFDGQYLLSVSQSEFTLSSSEKPYNELKVFTDYPKGWQAKVASDATWINNINPESGPANETTTLSFSVDKNETEFTRTGNIIITAGRLNYLIKVIQTPDEDFLLLVTDEYYEPVSELIFPSKSHLQFANMQQMLNVEWDPSDMRCFITEIDVLNHLDFEVIDNLDSTPLSASDLTERNIIGGFYQLYVEPEEMTDEELAENPFLEKVSRMDFTVHKESTYKVESVFLHQINYTVITDEAESYAMDGDDYSFHARCNTGWAVSIVNDPDNIIQTLYTTSGARNTGEGELVRFKMANNSLLSSTATLRFSSPEGRFDDIDVEINGLNLIAEPQGEANCYMLLPASQGGTTISIPVSRANADGRTRIKAGDVLTAELLWTDSPNGVSTNGVVAGYSIMGSGPEGDLIVTPGNTQGNAVIAVKVNGEIKWSWHIWVTNYQGATYAGSKGAQFMDRNLGATSITPGDVGTVGVYYQFGRKDPFPGPVSFTASTQIPIYNEKGERVNTTAQAVSTVDNINNGVMNPMTFYTGIPISNYDWSTNSGSESNRHDYLWEDRNGNATAYDPCPAGWRLPYATFSGSHWDNLAWSGYWNASQYGATWSTGSMAIGYWAASGYIDATTGNIVQSGDVGLGKAGYYWSRTINSWQGRGFSFRSSSYDVHTNSRKSLGQTIRCIKAE